MTGPCLARRTAANESEPARTQDKESESERFLPALFPQDQDAEEPGSVGQHEGNAEMYDL